MALSDIIKNGVALADRLTAGLQPTVIHEAWVGQSGVGGNRYADPVSRPAIVELKQRLVRSLSGEEAVSSHVISFLRPIAALAVTGRRNPIDPRDKITLPDGTTGLILTIEGFMNPGTGASYYHQVYLQGQNR